MAQSSLPQANYADWRKGLLAMLGAHPTSQNLKFLSSWQRWEGGHTNNGATYNWLNTTQNAPGAIGEINSVGVKKFKDANSGINALATTLLNGKYNDIVHALRAGNPYKNDVSAGLQTWVSGSPTGNPGYVQKILGTPVPKAALPAGGRGPTGNPGLAGVPKVQPPDIYDTLALAFNDDKEFLRLLRGITDSQAQRDGLVDPHGSVRPVPVAKGSVAGVIHAAQSQLGKPYVFGSGPDTSSFDCSDLIQWAYKQIGVDLPRTTFDQINAGRPVKWNQLKPGDLIFPEAGHVVMYVGHGKVIAAPHTGTVVQYQPVSRFRNPVAIRRVL